jgi:site-specific recombinase XerD
LVEEELRDFRAFMRNKGKCPNKREGLAEKTTENYISRFDQLLRAAWALEGERTFPITHEIADRIEEALQQDQINSSDDESYDQSSKRKFQNTLEKYFEYRSENGGDPWEPTYRFKESASQETDYFRREERSKLREAALESGQLPHYSSVTPEERSRIKRYLAQKIGLAKEEITRDVWNRHRESLKIPSLIFTALDAALRPIEVERSIMDWMRLDVQELHIPKDDSAKGRENWKVALTTTTARINKEWLKQRSSLSKYDGRDEIWLNRQANPYDSKTLNDLLDGLLQATDIATSDRDLSWYSIRHSTGTYMTEEEGLGQTSDQLRHKSIETTKRYDHSTIEARSSTLEKL